MCTGSNQQKRIVEELEADLGIPKSVVSEILTQDLGMKCAMAKFIVFFCYQSTETTTNDPDFLKKVITRGEW